MLLLGLRREDIIGEEEGGEIFKDHQHIVGNDLRIRPHITDGAQQGQTVKRTQGMVGDHNELAFRRDFVTVDAREKIGKIELLENLVNESQPAGFAMLADTGIDLLLPQQPAEAMDDEAFDKKRIFSQKTGDSGGYDLANLQLLHRFILFLTRLKRTPHD